MRVQLLIFKQQAAVAAAPARSKPRRWAASVFPNRYIAHTMFKSYWKLRRRRLRRKLSFLSINAHGQLVMRLFLQATCEPIWGLHVVRHRYLFFAH